MQSGSGLHHAANSTLAGDGIFSTVTHRESKFFNFTGDTAMNHSIVFTALTVAALTAPAAIAQDTKPTAAKPAMSMDMPKSMSSMDMPMHKAMMKGMKDMEGMKSSGNVDHDFAMMMKKHHESALEMAQAELQHGKDAKMRSMAKNIIESQKKEIKEFDQWLAKQKHTMSEPMAKSK